MKPTHETLIAEMTREQRHALLQRSDVSGLLHLAWHWGAILAVGAGIVSQVPYWQGLLPIQGILIITTFSLLHETTHKTPFRSAWLNTLAGHVCGFLIMIMPLWFRHFHTDHHRYTNNPDKDPELGAPRPSTWSQYLWYLTGVPVWWSQIRTILVTACLSNNDSYVPQKDRGRVRGEAVCFLAGYGACIGLSFYYETMILAWVWGVPVVLGQPFLRAYLLAEHGGCASGDNMLENTRTTFTNPVTRFLMWNMPYHIEHHAFPAVPFHKLPEFHARLRPHLGVTSAGYPEFHRSFIRSFFGSKPVTE